MNESKLFSVNTKDIIKGLLMAILTPAVFILQQSLEAGSLKIDWHTVLLASVAGGVGYLVKNFFTPPTKEAK